MQQLPKLITSEEVYDLDSFELRDLESAIKTTKTDDASWNKKAQKLLSLLELELKERDSVENFAVNIDQYAIYQNDTLKQILDDIKNRPQNYLDQIVTNYEKPHQLEKIHTNTQDQKRLPPENLSTSTLTQSTANKNTKKKNHLFEFMQDVLKKTDVSNQKFIIGQAVQGRFIPPPPKPKLTTVQKIKTEKEIRKKKKAALSKQNTRAYSQTKSMPTAASSKDETQSLKHSQIKEGCQVIDKKEPSQVIDKASPLKGKLIQSLEDHQKFEKELAMKDKSDTINLIQSGMDQQGDKSQAFNSTSQNSSHQKNYKFPNQNESGHIDIKQSTQSNLVNSSPIMPYNQDEEYDGIIKRNNTQTVVNNIQIPVYNGLTDQTHQMSDTLPVIDQKVFKETQKGQNQFKDSAIQQAGLNQDTNYLNNHNQNNVANTYESNIHPPISQQLASSNKIEISNTNEDTDEYVNKYLDNKKYQQSNVAINNLDQESEYQDQREQSHIEQHKIKQQQTNNQQVQSLSNKSKPNLITDDSTKPKSKVYQTAKNQSQNTIKQPTELQSRAATQQLSKRSEIEVEDCYEGESSDSEPKKIQLQKQLTRKVVASKPAKFVEIKYQKEDMTDIRKACEEMQLDKYMEQPKEEVKKVQEKKPRVPIQQITQPKQQVQSRFIQKMMTMIDDSKLVDYSDIVPSFQHLFSGFYNKLGNYNHLDSMREILSIFSTHIERVDNVDQLLSKYRMNPLSLNPNELVYVNDPRKIISYASKTGIDIQQYIARQMVFNQRLQEAGKPEQYFRVIKTKEEVYDIITRSFMRKQSWTELPHAIGLKTSWNVLWTWAKPQIDLNKLLFFQKVNHFQFNKNLARKDLLKKNIERCQKLGNKTQQIFDIIPTTFLLPKEYVQFMERFYKDGEQEGQFNLWIMKPTSKSRGRGITVVNDVSDVMYAEPVVLQKYLKNPLLLKGHKFDMRIYVLVTSFNPLECYLYKEGFARLTTQPFTLDINEIKNQYVHLTNFAVQKHNVNAGDIDNAFGGCKISLRQLKEKLADRNIHWTNIWDQVQEIILKSLVACQSEIPSNANSFELFGYDIIIDTNLKCWLLEVNSSPSLARDYLLDELIKQQLIDDIFELIEPIHFDRQKLCEVLERRILEEQGCKSAINTMNNSKLQCSRDLNYILKGQNIRKYGEMPKKMGGFMRLAPSETYDKLKHLVQSYKTVNGRGTID